MVKSQKTCNPLKPSEFTGPCRAKTSMAGSPLPLVIARVAIRAQKRGSYYKNMYVCHAKTSAHKQPWHMLSNGFSIAEWMICSYEVCEVPGKSQYACHSGAACLHTDCNRIQLASLRRCSWLCLTDEQEVYFSLGLWRRKHASDIVIASFCAHLHPWRNTHLFQGLHHVRVVQFQGRYWI